MDDAIDPRIGRRYRIAVRLLLYPLALGLIVVAWHHRPGGSEARASDYVAWSGVTAQGQDIRVSTADGVITSLSTHVAEPCSDGSTFTLDWAPPKRWLVQTGHRSEEHTSELQSHVNLVCRLLLDKKNYSVCHVYFC